MPTQLPLDIEFVLSFPLQWKPFSPQPWQGGLGGRQRLKGWVAQPSLKPNCKHKKPLGLTWLHTVMNNIVHRHRILMFDPSKGHGHPPKNTGHKPWFQAFFFCENVGRYPLSVCRQFCVCRRPKKLGHGIAFITPNHRNVDANLNKNTVWVNYPVQRWG
jgi:hypothetical protein